MAVFPPPSRDVADGRKIERRTRIDEPDPLGTSGGTTGTVLTFSKGCPVVTIGDVCFNRRASLDYLITALVRFLVAPMQEDVSP